MNHPFDEFSKSLSEESVPRRESLRRLGAVFAGALLGPLALGLGAASASPDDRRRTRRRTSGPNTPNGTLLRDPCKAFCRCGTKAKQSQCLAACRACNNNPRRLCGSCGNYTCTNLSSDPNCGACGNNCSSYGQTCCSGRCADLKNDGNNCGACGRVCPAETPYCLNGTCSACPSGQTKCGTSCVNLFTDAANCGACGNVCAGLTPHCNGGGCSEVYCPGGTVCFGVCTHTGFDPNNCGGCGIVCAGGDVCSGGVCQAAW